MLDEMESQGRARCVIQGEGEKEDISRISGKD